MKTIHFLALMFVLAVRSAVAETAPETVRVTNGANVQALIEGAPTNSLILFNLNEQLTLSTPLKIAKPLTLHGINARLPEKLGRSPLISVVAKGVTIEDFQLYGNTESVSQDERAPLIFIEAGDFRVEHGLVVNSSRHGIYVAPSKATGDIYGGVVRDIVGRGNARCVVAIGDHGEDGVAVHNVLVENIRAYDSSLRGAVNLKDGNDNVTVRDIYAENSVYAVDVQDHKKAGEVNRNITVENVYARRCRHAVRTNNRPLGHENLTIRNVTAVECAIPLRISNTEHVALENIRVLDHRISEEPYPPILVNNCPGGFIRDVLVNGSDYAGPALALVDSGDTVVDGFTLEGRSNTLTSGVSFIISTNASVAEFAGLRISHVVARGLRDGGVLLDSQNPNASLKDFIISDNVAVVNNRIAHSNGVIEHNLAPVTTEADAAGRRSDP